ncbi:hypothetical protein O0L34_g6585 [Tuta absoluta]|nr:hypothetical protein O0L34_g6585 [Tuta absoluta]
MFLYFRQVLFRPRTQLLVSATATIKNTEEKPGPPKKCNRNIKDKYMKKLIKDLDRVEDLARDTLYCPGCDKRLVLTDKQKGIQYCECPNTGAPKGTYDGWVPYMEAENIIIWRKEYKPGGLYAYKVYGRYKHVKAEDFANIQVDGAYRTVWDSAVANLSIVEKEANGMKDQMVLHWEVLWPRLFANRDYVYLRRHKEFNVRSRCYVHKDGIFPDKERCVPDINFVEGSNKCAHDKAKQKSLEMDKAEADAQTAAIGGKENTVYVIVSRSCVHPEVPHSKHAVRVMEYWSHMVITTLDGPDKPGMEFVLTYYDEPAVGGLPTAVTSWAMGRAGPVFLERMRLAAQQYKAWREQHTAVSWLSLLQ